MRKSYWVWLLILSSLAGGWGCARSKQIEKITKPVDQTAEKLVKIREYKSEDGETRAVLSPADTHQLKIQF